MENKSVAAATGPAKKEYNLFKWIKIQKSDADNKQAYIYGIKLAI